MVDGVKISQLPQIQASEVDDNDELPIVDVTTNTTKKITKARLLGTSFPNIDVDGGTIDGATIGATTPSTGAFTTLSSSGGITGDVTGNVTGNLTGDVTGDVTGNLTGNVTGDVTGNVTGNVTGTLSGNVGSTSVTTVNLTSTGTSTLNTANITSVDINSGSIDNTTIGATTPSTGDFTSLTATTADIDGGSIDNATIGATTPSSGAFTTLSASGGITGDVTGDLVGNVAGNVTSSGTSTFSTVDINAGAIDGTTVGSTVASSGAFTTLTSNNLNVNSSTTVDGVLDEDDFASNSATKLATQQSIKAYVQTHTGGNVGVLSSVLTNGNTTSGNDINVSTGDDITFADNSKAIFGAGSDLSIYHDGSNSVISDQGTGNIVINASSVDVTGALTVNGSTVSTGVVDLGAISTSISATAVDVFIYDTSKDSDGGAWRHRTQNTSWYNETLNTSTRGSRKEFPAVAVIVAEAGTVTIYDGDDPDLPMWMVFNAGVNNYIYQSNISSVSMLNGRMAVGQDLSAGISITDFIADKNICSLGHATANYVIVTPISTRNGGTRVLTTDILIASGVVKDVAMTVLPDAPIDPATGIQIPTIALATYGGVSVIKDDGTVVDIVYYYAYTLSVDFHAGGILFNGRSSTLTTGAYCFYPSIPNTDLSHPIADLVVFLESSTPALNTFGSQKTGDAIGLGKNTFVVGDLSNTTSSGLSTVAQDFTTQADSMVAYTTSDYTSGWMPGDIKGAFLASTEAGTISGNEVVTDGSFTNGLTDWSNTSIGSGSATVSSGAISLVGVNGSNRGRIEQSVSLVGGSTYLVEYEVTMVSGALAFGFSTTSGFSPIATYETTSGVKTYYLTVPSGGAYIGFTTHIGGGNGTVDNVSVKLVDLDRSVNANPLNINGTITRAAVATGAELVAYTGFSSSNYLEQPYNSDLDFGTGDFCIMGWGRTNINGTFLSRGDGVSAGSWYWIHTGGSSSPFYIHDGTAFRLALNVALPQADMVHFALLRRSGTVFLYGNGELMGSLSGTYPALSMTNLTAKLRIGEQQHASYVTTSEKQALLRISATAPTAEQIKKIYNDEKYLFQEGAACTIYGTSDAVTALAYDSDTELLHVGTSAGRSVFQGLRRIDNTTDAVGVAISAQNNLVADE